MSRKKPKYIKQRKSSFIPVLIVVAVLAIAAAVVVLVLVDRAPAVKQPAAPELRTPRRLDSRRKRPGFRWT